MLDALFLIVGFVVLIYSADILVDAAATLAKLYNVPSIVIGLTIVAFGTSAPELVVNTFASINNNSEMVLGNILGSNISNILLILGISALFNPLVVKKQTTWIEIPLSMLAAVSVFLLAEDTLIDGTIISTINHVDGYILLLFFLVFVAYNISLSIKNNGEEDLEIKDYGKRKSIIYIILGLIGLTAGGKSIVYGAANLAEMMGISQRVIGLTVVAIGTSLPEMITSVVAAKKGKTDIAIGNVVGSNLFNTFLVLGVSATISPIVVSNKAFIDLIINIAISFLLFLFMFTDKAHSVTRREGLIFVLMYIIYILWVIIN